MQIVVLGTDIFSHMVANFNKSVVDETYDDAIQTIITIRSNSKLLECFNNNFFTKNRIKNEKILNSKNLDYAKKLEEMSIIFYESDINFKEIKEAYDRQILCIESKETIIDHYKDEIAKLTEDKNNNKKNVIN